MKKILCGLLLLIAFITPIQAKQKSSTLLIPSDGYYYYLITNQKTDFQIFALSKYTKMPITCLNYQISDTHDFASNQTARNCLINSINHTFDTNITHYVTLNSKKMANALDLPNSKHDPFQQLTNYFLSNKVSLSLFDLYELYQSLSTDLSLSNLYRYYQLFTSKQFHYEKHYPFSIYYEKTLIPLSIPK